MDATDRQILAILQEEGRITNADLAQRIGLTAGPVHARVAKLEAAGIIDGYAALVNRTAVGLPFTAYVSVIMHTHGKLSSQKFLQAAKDMPEVIECHHIAGAEDYLLKVVAASPSEYENFVLDQLLEMPEVQRVHTTIVLSTQKSTTAVPIRETIS